MVEEEDGVEKIQEQAMDLLCSSSLSTKRSQQVMHSMMII